MNKFTKFLEFKSYLYYHHMKLLAKFFDKLLRYFYACDIPSSVKIGKNCYFPHGALGVTIHPRSIIGDNCTIYQNVTIGCRNKKGPPIIENNVLIGCGACVLGDVRIGANVNIGANSVVLCSVDSNCTVVGIPAKVVKTKELSDGEV